MATKIKEIAEAVQISLHSWHFDDIGTGSVEETGIVTQEDDCVTLSVLTASGEEFQVTVSR